MILKPNEINVPLLNHLNKFSAEHNDICSGNVSRRIACSFFIPHAPTTNLPQKSSIRKRPAPCVHLFWVEATSSVRRSDCNKCEWIWPPWRKKLHGSSSKSWNWKLRCFQKIDSSEGRGWVLGWGFFSPVGCFIVTWILAVFGECDSRVCWGVLWSGSETMRTYWEVQQKVIMFHPHLRKFFWWTAQLPTISSSFAKKPCHGIPGSCGEWSGMACKLNAETFCVSNCKKLLYCPGDFLEKLRFRVICVSFIRGVFVGENGWRTFRRSRCACFWKNNVLPMLNSKISCFFL